MGNAALDDFLAECLRAALENRGLPHWPHSPSPESITAAKDRIKFHGIALILADEAARNDTWPEEIKDSIADEARLQVLWEADHAEAVSRLIDGLTKAGFAPIVMKGTALAYALYDDPAQRRRGDTDILVETDERSKLRAQMEALGFAPSGERRALQEGWALRSPSGFTHSIDLHWSINSSMAIAQMFERDHPRHRTMALPKLSAAARAIGPTDSFIQTCINRIAHAGFGYLVDDTNVREGDRLIWALDLHLLAASFDDRDWDQLAETAMKCEASAAVISGLRFAGKTLHTNVAEGVLKAFEQGQKPYEAISEYFSAPNRIARDIRAAPTLALKWSVFRALVWPDQAFLQQRYPSCGGWPLAVLRLRRVLDAGVRMLLDRRP